MTMLASDLVSALHQRSQPALGAGPVDGADEEFQMPMRDLFDIAEAHRELPLSELETLLDEPAHPVRLAAVCVLDFKARTVGTRGERRPLRELYLRRHDRIDSWDMVDRGAPWVVGGSLDGHDLSALHQLAASPRPIERRSAITAPLYFVKFGDDNEVDPIVRDRKPARRRSGDRGAQSRRHLHQARRSPSSGAATRVPRTPRCHHGPPRSTPRDRRTRATRSPAVSQRLTLREAVGRRLQQVQESASLRSWWVLRAR